jgi:hypothetical protein
MRGVVRRAVESFLLTVRRAWQPRGAPAGPHKTSPTAVRRAATRSSCALPPTQRTCSRQPTHPPNPPARPYRSLHRATGGFGRRTRRRRRGRAAAAAARLTGRWLRRRRRGRGGGLGGVRGRRRAGPVQLAQRRRPRDGAPPHAARGGRVPAGAQLQAQSRAGPPSSSRRHLHAALQASPTHPSRVSHPLSLPVPLSPSQLLSRLSGVLAELAAAPAAPSSSALDTIATFRASQVGGRGLHWGAVKGRGGGGRVGAALGLGLQRRGVCVCVCVCVCV